MATPLVSICIPCYNAEKYIGETLDCLLSQSYRSIEILVVDDRSSDNSFGLVNNYSAKYPNVKLKCSVRKGAASARNQAFAESTGEFIVFFDADDLIDATFIQTQVETLLRNPDSVSISNWGRFYNNNIESYNEDPFIIKEDMTFYDWIVRYWTFHRHTTPPGRVMIPRTILEKSGLWNEALTLNDDFEFFTRVFLNAVDIKYNDKANFYYRSGVGGLSGWKSTSSYRSYLNSLVLSSELVRKKYGVSSEINLACANMLQMFNYEVYPKELNLYKTALKYINKLEKPTIPFPSGGATLLLSKVIGWKLTKRFKLLFKF